MQSKHKYGTCGKVVERSLLNHILKPKFENNAE